MSSRINSIVILLTGILASGNGFAQADEEGICPKYPNAKIKQIRIFDGKPEELIALAPDDEPNDEFTTVGYLYDQGHTVTIRCEYDTGFIFDIELTKKVDKCKGLENKAGVLNLVCK